jgi:acyl carrier protein
MTISSRTPEGFPHRCSICGKQSAVDPSFPGGDSTCPSCGHLLWWFRDRLGLDSEPIHVDSLLLDDLGADSLDLVELVMEIEQEFGIAIPDEEAERIRTVSDAIRYIIDHRGEAA